MTERKLVTCKDGMVVWQETNKWYTDKVIDMQPIRHRTMYNNRKYYDQWSIPKQPPFSVTFYADYWGPGQHYGHVSSWDESNWVEVTEDYVFNMPLTLKEFPTSCKKPYAALLKSRGYEGPLQQGVGNGLRAMLKHGTKYADCIRRGWVVQTKPFVQRWGRTVDREYLKGPCYLFKSPVPGLNGAEFMRLCSITKKAGKNYETVITELMNNPSDLEKYKGLLTIDTLAKGLFD